MIFRKKILWGLLFLVPPIAESQVLIHDFRINSAVDNVRGVWRTSVAAMPDGRFAVAWQDDNDYTIPVAEHPRVAVQMFNANATPFGPLNLFAGESRSITIWTSDALGSDIDIEYTPDGALLVAVEHSGRLSLGGDDIWSSEVGIGAVDNSGDILDVNNTAGVILWNATTRVDWQEDPRITVGPQGDFLLVANGPTFSTRRHSIELQAFDPSGNYVGNPLIPHAEDPGPDFNYYRADVATNGAIHAVCWQDERLDAKFDIAVQFYSNDGTIGKNQQVNSGDANGTINIWPSIAMAPSGNSLVVWADTRVSPAGDIYGQRFNSSGATVGSNFRISAGRGEIMDRPEVAMLDDGSFMVVWTDSSAVFGDNAFRAMGRQFAANAQPTNDPFVIPDSDIPSGLVNIASDGSAYYCAWLDGRDGGDYWNVYAKKFGPAVTSVKLATESDTRPDDFSLADAYPNPFNPETMIEFSIPQTAHVEINVFNMVGEQVAALTDAVFQPGLHKVTFSAEDLPSGLYVYRIQAVGFMDSKKVLLLK